MNKSLFPALITTVLFLAGCAENNHDKLPPEVISLLTSESNLLESYSSKEPSDKVEELPYEVIKIGNDLALYIVTDSVGMNSEINPVSHYIVLQDRETYKIVFSGPSDNLHFIKSSDSIPMLEFDYVILGAGQAESRHSRFKYDGTRYKLVELCTIDNQPVVIPTSMLISIGYPFNSNEISKANNPNYELNYSSLKLLRTVRSSKGDSLFIVKHLNEDSSMISWLFAPKSQGYSLIQVIADDITPRSVTTNKLYDLLGSSRKIYKWDGAIYSESESQE